MKVFLIGDRGTLGPPAAAALRSAGYEVADPRDQSMSGCDVVVSLAPPQPVGHAALAPGAWRRHDRHLAEGSHRLAEAARSAGVPRFVQCSSSVLYADSGDDRIDEFTTIDLTQATEPFVIAEANAEQFGRDGGEHVVLRLGRIVGPTQHTAWMVRRARSGRPTGFGDPQSWIHLIRLEDAAAAVVAAVTAPPGTYNVGAEPTRRHDLAEQYALAGERRGPRFHSPLTHRLGGRRLEMLTRSQRVSSQRFGDRTGWHPAHPKLTPDWFDRALVDA